MVLHSEALVIPGLKQWLDSLMAGFVVPLGRALLADQLAVDEINTHYTFYIQYEEGGDKSLEQHKDQALLTFNVCLVCCRCQCVSS